MTEKMAKNEILKKLELNDTFTLFLGAGVDMKVVTSQSIRFAKGEWHNNPMWGTGNIPEHGEGKLSFENFNEWMSFKQGLNIEVIGTDRNSAKIKW